MLKLLYPVALLYGAGVLLLLYGQIVDSDAIQKAGAWLMVPITVVFGVAIALYVLIVAAGLVAGAARAVLRRMRG